MRVVNESCTWCGYGRMAIVASKKAIRKQCTGKGCEYMAWIPKSQLTNEEKKRYRIHKEKREESTNSLLQPPQASSIVLRGVKQYLAMKSLPPKERKISYLK